MRKAAGCVLLAILCLLGASYLPRILQEAQTDREQQNLISGYIQNPDTTDEENRQESEHYHTFSADIGLVRRGDHPEHDLSAGPGDAAGSYL